MSHGPCRLCGPCWRRKHEPADRDFEDLLRRALHSAAGSVEPSPDGLERIRGRLTTPYPLPVAWMMAVYSQAARWTLGGLSSLGAWLEAVPGSVRQRRRVTRPSPSRGRRPSRVVLAAALAGTALAVAIGAGALTPPLRHAMVQTGLLIRSITSGGSAIHGPPAGEQYGEAPGAVSGMAPGTGSNPQPNPANCAAPQPVLATTPTSPATSATTTASPSPTACATLTTSPTATNPSPASSPSPSQGAQQPEPDAHQSQARARRQAAQVRARRLAVRARARRPAARARARRQQPEPEPGSPQLEPVAQPLRSPPAPKVPQRPNPPAVRAWAISQDTELTGLPAPMSRRPSSFGALASATDRQWPAGDASCQCGSGRSLLAGTSISRPHTAGRVSDHHAMGAVGPRSVVQRRLDRALHQISRSDHDHLVSEGGLEPPCPFQGTSTSS